MTVFRLESAALGLSGGQCRADVNMFMLCLTSAKLWC